MVLRAGQWVRSAGPGHFQADGDIGRGGRAEDISVETHPLAHAAGHRPAVAQRHRDREVRLAGKDQGGDLQAAAGEVQPHDVAGGHAQRLRGRRADDGGVIPGQLGDRVGELLQPAVIGEPAVVDLGIAVQDEFEVIGRERYRERAARPPPPWRSNPTSMPGVTTG